MGEARLRIQTCVIEITRRCNMHCIHCLRGPAQDMDIEEQYIWNLFANTSEIDTLIFSGGEPTLYCRAIFIALHAAIANDTKVHSVYIPINGKEVTDRFLELMRDWNTYCLYCEYGGDEDIDYEKAAKLISWATDENDITPGVTVALSLDEFHEPISVKNVRRLLSLPKLVLDKYQRKDSSQWVIPEGNAKDNLDCAEPYDMYYDPEWAGRLEMELDDPDDPMSDAVIEQLYLSATGNILRHCDWSYATQEKFVITNISDPAWAAICLEKSIKTE